MRESTATSSVPIEAPVLAGARLMAGFTPAMPCVFDGHKFPSGYGLCANPMMLNGIYLAARARAGDVVAIRLLTAFEATVLDNDQRRYWPPEDAALHACLLKLAGLEEEEAAPQSQPRPIPDRQERL